MNIIIKLKNFFSNVKSKFKEDSVDNVIWILNIVPNLVGYSLHKERISIFAPFWCVHVFLLFYVYGVGSFVYQVNFARSAEDFIKSYVNVTLLILIGNNTYWWLKHRPLLNSVLKKIKQSDNLVNTSPELQTKHNKLLFNIKIIILIVYSFNWLDEIFIYVPHRTNIEYDFSMTPCVGMGPLSASPNHEICVIILGVQEISITTVVLTYQTLLLFLIDHTSAMYQMLAEEILTLDTPGLEKSYIKEKLHSLMIRHALTLDIVDKLKMLYSVPIGINFLTNAVCICLFFYLPLEELLGFVPILVYCFLVFFLYCFLCQRLTNAAEVFERAVYACGWEKFNVEEMKTIYVMLLQAQVKVEIVAADIIPVNISTFATTLQAIFKFVTVVKF